MYQFIESICCTDGNVLLLDLHQERVNKTFGKYFPKNVPIVLSDEIENVPSKGKYKCRIEYGENIESLEYLFYKKPKIKSIKPVVNDEIIYEFKSSDRMDLSALFDERGSADDVMIVKKGLVTDSCFANLVFYDGGKWFTPETTLLDGVKRKSLLKQGLIKRKRITVEDLLNYGKVSLINAMLDMGEIEIYL